MSNSSPYGAFAFWPGRDLLIYFETAGTDGAPRGTQRRYDPITGGTEVIAALEDRAPARHQFSPSGDTLLMHGGGRVMVYSMEGRSLVDSGLSTGESSAGARSTFIDDHHVAIVERGAPDGDTFAVWSLSTGSIVRYPGGDASSTMDLSPAGTFGVVFHTTGTEEDPAVLVDLQNGQRVETGVRVLDVRFTPDDRTMLLNELMADRSSHYVLVNARTLERRLLSRNAAQTSYGFGERGRLAWVAEVGGPLQVFDLSGATGVGSLSARLPMPPAFVGTVAYPTLDGENELVVRQPSGHLARVDVHTGAITDIPLVLPRVITCPDHHLVIAGDTDDRLRSHALYAVGRGPGPSASLLWSEPAGGLVLDSMSNTHAVFLRFGDGDSSSLWALRVP